MNSKSNLQSLLDQVNTLLDSNMKIDYAPQYGGYMLAAVPREYRFLQSNYRVPRQEMAAFLYGVLSGMRALATAKNI